MERTREGWCNGHMHAVTFGRPCLPYDELIARAMLVEWGVSRSVLPVDFTTIVRDEDDGTSSYAVQFIGCPGRSIYDTTVGGVGFHSWEVADPENHSAIGEALEEVFQCLATKC